MTEINAFFQPRFVPLLKDGRKQQTIRQRCRFKVAPNVGDRIVCAAAKDVEGRNVIPGPSVGTWPVTEVLAVEFDLVYGGICLGDRVFMSGEDLERLAQQDGFTCFEDMLQWFRGHYRDLQHFEGWLIGWVFEERIAA